MIKISNGVRHLVEQVDKRKLRNNTQRVLFALLTSGEEWVSRAALRIPSASARLRDLRKEEFGGFDVQCRNLAELKTDTSQQGRAMLKSKDTRSTFYRLNPRSVTTARVLKAFKGVISDTK